jgi:HSP20 family protein
MGSMLNPEIPHFQGYNPRVRTYEGPKSYRIDAEVPGFRKEDLSIEFPKKHFIRIKGKRSISRPAETEFEDTTGDYISYNSADTADAQETVAAEPTTAADSAVSSAESKEVKVAEADEVETQQSRTVEFTNQWSLPEDVDIDGVKAKLDHGILSVFLPKKVEPEFERKVHID